MILISLLILIVSFIIILCTPYYYIRFIKSFSFFVSFFVFLIYIFIWFNFDKIKLNFQYSQHFLWNENLNIYYSVGIDGLSLLFLILSTFLIPLCIIYIWNHFDYCFKEIVLLLYLIDFLLLNFFLVLDIFFFFIFFEAILIPMFILIGNFGSRQRKIHATFQFFLFTMIGSFFMLISILLVYLHEGSTDLTIFHNSCYTYNLELILWLSFFLSLSVKIPLFPLHIWLPEAHVEAPTIGSVILAGILLKMGSYGYLRFIVPTFPIANYFFNPIIFILSFLSIYYISILTFCQVDLKKLIAYSSVSHMGFVTISLFTYNFQGLQGGIFLMLSHGIVSSLLFFLVGMLYDRYKSRIIFFYRALQANMPVFSIIFLFATLANFGFPGTISFIGEFLIMYSFFLTNKIIFLFNSLGFLFSIIYSFWLYNKTMVLIPYNLHNFSDINKREFFAVFPLIFCLFFFGIFPNIILNTVEFYVYYLIVLSNY